MTIDRKKVLEAFKDLRKQNFMARANFCCCSTCAISELVEKRRGQECFVYWHRQDNERLLGGGPLYIRYGSFSERGGPPVGRSAEEAGERVVLALVRAGVGEVHWDGDTNKTIIIGGCDED